MGKVRTARSAGRRPAVILVAATVACGLSACSGAGGKSSATSSAHDSPTAAAASSSRVRPLPDVGSIVIAHGRQGLVIRDRATHGRRFYLSGAQAGECLNFLAANPAASPRDVRAACPGETRARLRNDSSTTSSGR